MRQLMLDTIETTKDYKLSGELPWTSSRQPLYLKNLKTVYVGEPIVQVEPLIAVLAGTGPQAEIMSLTVYVANDAKRLPATYLQQLGLIARLVDLDVPGVFRRDQTSTTEYQTDVVVNSYTFRYTRIKGEH